MRKNRKKHQHAKLPEGLEKRLAVYALAAGAAGAALAATAQPARADIISTTNIKSTIISSLNEVIVSGRFQTSNGQFYGTHSYPFLAYQILPTGVFAGGLGGIMATGPNTWYGYRAVRNLSPGGSIGPAGSFAPFGAIQLRSSSGTWRAWNGSGSAYVGLRFGNSQSGVFGWAKLSLGRSNTPNSFLIDHITVEDAAFEICPNVSIQAGWTNDGGLSCNEPTNTPEPSTLALLAMGAVGLFALRRKKLAGSN